MPTLRMHYYRFAAKKGERIAFEVVAQRMNSRADPIVRIHNTAGREIAYCDDTPGLGADPCFAHVFKADGEYLAEVRDANYEGGPECRYRLRIGDFPTATVPFPLSGKRGSMTAFAFEGPDGDQLDPLNVKLDTTASLQLVALKSPGGRSSSFASILVSDTEDFVTSQPNHSPAASARVKFPANISGRLTAASVRDFYRFTGKKGIDYRFAPAHEASPRRR